MAYLASGERGAAVLIMSSDVTCPDCGGEVEPPADGMDSFCIECGADGLGQRAKEKREEEAREHLDGVRVEIGAQGDDGRFPLPGDTVGIFVRLSDGAFVALKYTIHTPPSHLPLPFPC